MNIKLLLDVEEKHKIKLGFDIGDDTFGKLITKANKIKNAKHWLGIISDETDGKIKIHLIFHMIICYLFFFYFLLDCNRKALSLILLAYIIPTSSKRTPKGCIKITHLQAAESFVTHQEVIHKSCLIISRLLNTHLI